MKWNVSVLRRSGECERTEVADFELSEFFNRIASAEGKAWVLSVERVGDVGDSALVEPDGDELVSQLGKLVKHPRGNALVELAHRLVGVPREINSPGHSAPLPRRCCRSQACQHITEPAHAACCSSARHGHGSTLPTRVRLPLLPSSRHLGCAAPSSPSWDASAPRCGLQAPQLPL